MSSLDISEGVGHDGGMDEFKVVFILWLAFVLVCVGAIWLDSNEKARISDQFRAACQSRTCKTEHTSPRLNRYGECVCVEMAQ